MPAPEGRIASPYPTHLISPQQDPNSDFRIVDYARQHGEIMVKSLISKDVHMR
jgi:hypothetical protein